MSVPEPQQISIVHFAEPFPEFIYVNRATGKSVHGQLISRSATTQPDNRIPPHEGVPAMQGTLSNSRVNTTIGLSEAARVLTKLGLCKAFGPSGHINGPNCQRFEKRDSATGRWQWDVAELISKAREKGTASLEQIAEVAKECVLLLDPPGGQENRTQRANHPQTFTS